MTKMFQVCLEHFLPMDFVSSVHLRANTIPSVFHFQSKGRSANHAWALSHHIQLAYPSQNPSESDPITSITNAVPATKDIGIQCG